MSDENKELLARIGQLAGQINRHKNRNAAPRASSNLHPAHHGSNAYRATKSYGQPSYRVARPHAHAHHHRSLQLSKTGTASPATGESDSADSSSWVSRTDRHRQLINADVYAKQSQNRARAMQESRKRGFTAKRHGEKARFNAFLQQQASNNATTPGGSNHTLTLEGIEYRVMDGGKKLFRLPGASPATWEEDRLCSHAIGTSKDQTTPKSVTVAGVVFHRTKSGNLVANRVVTKRHPGVVKTDQLCKIFSMTGKFSTSSRPKRYEDGSKDWPPFHRPTVLTITPTGSCTKGPHCRFIHDPKRVAVCKDYLKDGRCAFGESCDLSHDLSPERVPNCLHYAKGHCAKADCPYTHTQASAGAPVCGDFGFFGFCSKGAECSDRHVFECPDFSNTGRCKNKGCKLPHRERASVLRNDNEENDPDADVSSDDDNAGMDDVDSDAVAEFLEADSDDSDFENSKDFIPL